MQRTDRVLVTGAGGFIGHHLVKRLKAEGKWVRGVDIKMPEYETTAADEFKLLDLGGGRTALRHVTKSTRCTTWRRTWAASATSPPTSPISPTTIRSSMHTCLKRVARSGVSRPPYSSSACVYAGYKQRDAEVTPLKEEDAYPAHPSPVTAGKNCMPRNSAGTDLRKTTSSRHESFGSTTSMARWERTTAARKNHPQRYPAKWRWQATGTRLKSGAMASRRARICTSTIASKD